jgi:hypothetical protein
LATTTGDLGLRLPELRAGSFFPTLLERRRRVDQALFAVVMRAYVHVASTRKVDDLEKALGVDAGISKSEVSRICTGLDAEVAQFRDRTLASQDFPYMFLDATCRKARVGHRIVSQAVVGRGARGPGTHRIQRRTVLRLLQIGVVHVLADRCRKPIDSSCHHSEPPGSNGTGLQHFCDHPDGQPRSSHPSDRWVQQHATTV